MPGEHGFRFFPGFYRHIPDTMKRIPFAGGSVFNNLVPAPMAMFARHGRKDAKFPTHAPRTLKAVIRALYTLFHTDLGLSFGEVRFFLRQLAYLATSCEERRITQVEKLDWTFWVDAKNPKWSDAYRMYCADGLTRLLVAAKADDISARTAGVTLLQLMLDMAPGAVGADRVLNGPTNDVWIDPWVTFLTEQRGVHHATGVTVRDIVIEGGLVARVDAERDGKPMTINAQYYVSALPGDVVGRMVTDNHDLADVGLGGVRKLVFEWMNGYQFYMKAPVKIVAGHTAYMESKWSLTSISQGQFWKQPIADTYGKGEVHDILSVDISDWEVEGSNGKCAKDCTEAELKEEVLRQIEDHVNDDEVKFDRGDIMDCHLDQSLIWRDGVWENLDPLLINKQGTWRHRPDAALPKIPNLFVAGDYVQTFTDLATMESANEGGRARRERDPDGRGTRARRHGSPVARTRRARRVENPRPPALRTEPGPVAVGVSRHRRDPVRDRHQRPGRRGNRRGDPVSFSYGILGPLEVRRDGALVDLGSGRQRALLAMLVLHAGEVVSADRIIDDLWGESPPDSAANAVQGYISKLRPRART